VAAVTSRHQRVAVRPLILRTGSDMAAAHGHGHNRCRRQVAPFNNVGTSPDEFASTLVPNNVQDGTPAHRAFSTPGGRVETFNVRRLTCNLQS
jgi:hypothetical protein